MPEEKKGGDPEKVVGTETKAAAAAAPTASPKNGKPGNFFCSIEMSVHHHFGVS